MPPPFRLLAITPPQGPVPADILACWWPFADLALLLREPGTPAAQLLGEHHRLAPIRRACVEAGIPVLLSVGPDELDPSVFSKRSDIAGLHLRGDPDLATLARARALPRSVSPDSPGLASLTPRSAAPDNSGLASLTPRSAAPDSPGIAGLTPRSAAPDSPGPAPRSVSSDSPGTAGPWLGRSCHGLPQPGDELVDYTLFAPVFAPTTAQPGRPLGSKIPAGLAALQAWAARPGAVVFALGGVGPATAARCLAAGARGLAGIGVFFGEPGQVEQDVAALREIVAASDRHVEPVSPR